MLIFSFILLLGLIAGVLIGLLPGLPAYLSPLLLYPFINILTIDQIMAFWLAAHIGSQYYGSVAAILLKIPGEASSMIYLKDLDKLTVTERLSLVRQTAWGSTMGSLAALAALMVVYYLGLSTELIQLTNNNIKLGVLLTLIFTLCYFSDSWKVSALMFFIGVALVEKTNYELPMWIFSAQKYTSDITVFSLILGLLMIPEFIKEVVYSRKSDKLDVSDATMVKTSLNFQAMWRGTWVGSLIGLVPGPSHILASIMSYNSYKNHETVNKIISAESANNSATITSLLPFLYVGLPITLSEILLNNIFQVKLFSIPGDLNTSWSLFHGINLIEFCFGIILFSTLVYHFLSQQFLAFYEKLMKLAHSKLAFVYIALIIYLIYIDVSFSPISVIPYVISLLTTTIIGCILIIRRINVLPLLFGYILGDMICWSLYHFYQIHFY